MALSVRTSAMAGGPPPGGGDWGDSPYGSLISLGPKTLKKKPVLVLAAEELAEAHLAMAMGGAEIMEMQPDPVAAPRPRQPSIMLGLVPMGVDEADEGRAAWVPPAAIVDEDDADWQPLPEFDEPEPEEAEVQTWVPEDEPEEWPEGLDEPQAWEEPADDLAAPTPEETFALMPEPQLPSIEDQLAQMRERLAKRAAASAAAPAIAAPAPAVVPPTAPVERPPSTIERLEIDDWSGGASLKGFIPPQEEDLAPAPPPAAGAQLEPAARAPEPVAIPAPAPALAAVPPPVEEPYEPDLAAVLPEGDGTTVDRATGDLATDNQAALHAWDAHVAPVAPPRRHAGIRARLSDEWQGREDEPAPSLLARLWGWLRARF